MPAVDQTQVTGGRRTRLNIDIPDPVLGDPAIVQRRQGAQIGTDLVNGYKDAGRLSNLRYWPSGCWTLDVVQTEITNIHEYIDTAHLIIPQTGFRLIQTLTAGVGMVATIKYWRVSSDLPGMVFNAGLIAATGDPWMVRKVPTGQSIKGVPVDSSTPIPGGIALDIPLDRCGESSDAYPADQGFFLRWTLPGTGKHHPGSVWNFYFGQYCLAIKGSGLADLYEHCHDSAGVLQWRVRDTFRYARPSQISDASHTMLIYPHTGPNGEKYINFAGGQPDAAGYLSGYTTNDASHVAPTHHVYRADESKRNGDVDESPGHATKADICRFDMRRDLLKLEIQISTLGFWQNGFLLDLPYEIPWYAVQALVSPTVDIRADQPPGTSVTTQILSGNTNPIGGTFDPAKTTHPVVKYVFTGDGKSTPRLWESTFTRPQTISDGAGVAWWMPVMAASVSGYAGDGSEQSGFVNVQDVTGVATLLSKRGRFAASLETQFQPPTGDPVWVRLMRGYIYRPQGELRGHRALGVSGGGGGQPGTAGVLYPSADWGEYALPIVGMNLRLNERFNLSEVVSYARDLTATPDPVTKIFPPVMATAAIRDLLGKAGFPATMINIPDVPIRLWFGASKNATELFSQPGSTYGEMAARIARDYLGAHLYFDESGGDAGQWTVLYGQQLNPIGDPLLYFVRGTAAANALPHAPGAYPDNMSGANPAPTTFVLSVKSQPVPIEFNSVRVVCPSATDDKNTQVLCQNFMANPKSFLVPSMTTPPDPNHPDYLGYEKRLTVIDLACQAISDQNGSTLRHTQDNVDWKTRRLYDFLCHGQQGKAVEAPLVFLKDAITAKWRMPRFMDKINYDGQNALLRSCSPRYTQDTQQMAIYEIVQVIT